MNNNIYKTVTVNDELFVIRKFDARTGLKIARLMIAKAAPFLAMLEAGEGGAEQAAISENSSDRLYEMLGKFLGSLDDGDIDSLIGKCLRVVSKQLPAGLQPVMDETGYYGVEGVEYDLKLTLRLVYEALLWGASDFFGERGLAGALP